MADAIITFKIMPDSPEVDLDVIEQNTKPIIEEFGGEIGKKEIVPVAFGIKALQLVFVMDENLGDTEDVEKKIAALEGVNSVEVVDVRRALG